MPTTTRSGTLTPTGRRVSLNAAIVLADCVRSAPPSLRSWAVPSLSDRFRHAGERRAPRFSPQSLIRGLLVSCLILLRVWLLLLLGRIELMNIPRDAVKVPRGSRILGRINAV